MASMKLAPERICTALPLRRLVVAEGTVRSRAGRRSNQDR
jgi:hypothetical protein